MRRFIAPCSGAVVLRERIERGSSGSRLMSGTASKLRLDHISNQLMLSGRRQRPGPLPGHTAVVRAGRLICRGDRIRLWRVHSRAHSTGRPYRPVRRRDGLAPRRTTLPIAASRRFDPELPATRSRPQP
jgi:hypothetical protein